MKKEHEVSTPLPKPYTCCSKCSELGGEDCGEHSMDFAWRGLVARLQESVRRFRNERDYLAVKYGNLAAETAADAGKHAGDARTAAATDPQTSDLDKIEAALNELGRDLWTVGNYHGNRFADHNEEMNRLDTIQAYQRGFMMGVRWLIVRQVDFKEDK